MLCFWTKATLDAFIVAREDFAPGNLMTFVGLPDPEQRPQMIAYLVPRRVGAGKE
jgi:cytochrome c2